jgi:hypothetical protein
MSESKLALIAHGPGFSGERDLQNLLAMRNYRVEFFSLNHGFNKIDPARFAAADFVLLRGPWRLSFEEGILSRMLALQLKKIIGGRDVNEQQRMVGVGRGAMILMKSLPGRFPSDLTFTWSEAFKGKVPWIKTYLRGSDSNYSYTVTESLPVFDDPSERLQPWIGSEAGTCGWHVDNRLFFSFVDPFAYRDPSQLRGFGFEDLSQSVKIDKVLDSVLG